MNLPPVHPAVVHLPIACVFLSVIADVLARVIKNERRRAPLRILGFGALAAGLIGGALTIVAGYIDLARVTLDRQTEEFVELHLTLGWVLAGCLVVLTTWRWLIQHRGQMTINNSYLVAAVAALALTLFQGWYGGELVYSLGAGVAPAGQGTEPGEAGQSRLAAVRALFEPHSTALGGAESPGGTNVSDGTESEH